MFGEFHPDLLAKLGVDAPIAGFELYLDALPAAKRKGTAKVALDASDLQAVRRDFAFLLDRDVPAGEVVRAASGADRALIAGVNVFDVFTGQGVPEGKKSLAIEVTLQPRDKTLTDAEIEAVAIRSSPPSSKPPAASCAASSPSLRWERRRVGKGAGAVPTTSAHVVGNGVAVVHSTLLERAKSPKGKARSRGAERRGAWPDGN